VSIEKIQRMLTRKPPDGRLREQLFWLVDIVYACKSSGDKALLGQAQLVEQALGDLGAYLETGDTNALDIAATRVQEFAHLVNAKVGRAQK